MDTTTGDLETDCRSDSNQSDFSGRQDVPLQHDGTAHSLPERLQIHENVRNSTMPGSSNIQLSAENLVSIITEKDQDLAQEREKVKQLEGALERRENTMTNIMKLRLNLSQEFHSLPVNLETRKGEISDKTHSDNTLQSRGLTDPSEGQADSMASLSSQIVVTPGISKTMFDNVVRENVKMKKTLQELLNKEGMNVKMFMETKELEEVIKKLREELFQKQGQVDQLERLIQNGTDVQSPAGVQQLTDLQLKVSRLEKAIAAKSQLVDSLSAECNKVREECAQLRSKIDILGAENQKLQNRLSPATEQNVQGELLTQKQEYQQTIAEYNKEIGRLQGLLRQEMMVREKLQLQCQEYAAASYEKFQSRQNMPLSHIELRDQITKLQQERDVLHHDLRKTIEEKSLLETQNEYFREDFATEKRKKYRLQQKYELFISQQQIQIRQLADENEKLHKLFQDMSKSKNRQLPSNMPPCSGAVASPLSIIPASREVMADGPSNTQQEEELVYDCPRCMRQFTEFQKFTEHTRKCTDS